MIITKKLSEVPVMETAHRVDARNLYNTEDAVITVITLKKGQSLKKHITPVDVAFYVLKGKGVVQIGDEKMTVDENTLVESPKDILHCWYNESNSDLVFMVIKAPRPKRKTVFVA
jgi:quercetin dioxygenase-like cupin family protein